jgi:hypothetical protein
MMDRPSLSITEVRLAVDVLHHVVKAFSAIAEILFFQGEFRAFKITAGPPFSLSQAESGRVE